MSSTLSRVQYALRPAKNIERKMMCDVFALLGRISPLNQYRYMGMGALGFNDHALFHRRLGIQDMVSIEKNVTWKERVELNRPYNCIGMEWGTTNDRLPTLSWTNPTIAWLDYDGPLDRSILDDIHTVTANALPGSVLVVTVAAHPEKIEPVEKAPKQRMEKLVGRVGEDRVPSCIAGKHLAKWGLADVSRSIVLNEIMDALAQKNGPEAPERKISFSQLFNFRYADTSKMMTVGGLLATDRIREQFEGPGLGDFDFVRTGEEALELQLPRLTLRELRYLNRRLPAAQSALSKLKTIPEIHVERFRKLYRYFPAFTEIETTI